MGEGVPHLNSLTDEGRGMCPFRTASFLPGHSGGLWKVLEIAACKVSASRNPEVEQLGHEFLTGAGKAAGHGDLEMTV